MKKVRTIKILVTTREIMAARSEEYELSAEADLPLCPLCRSQITEAVSSAVATLSETEAEMPSAAEHDCQ